METSSANKSSRETAAKGSKLLVADPALLCLPPLRPGEKVRPTGARLARAVPAALPRMGRGFNLFGVHDIRGRGTHVEPSPHCDPFVMCTAAVVPAGAKLPFCAHPHCGASVATIFLQGTAVRPWDNVNGPEEERLLPGGIYHVDTGAGVVHDEPLEPVDARALSRPSFNPSGPASVACAPGSTDTQLLQLWWNAVDFAAAEGAPLRPLAAQVVAPADVPRIVQPDGLALRVLAGSYRGAADPLAATVTHPVLLLHVQLPPGGRCSLADLPVDFNGFAWLLEGSAEVGGGPGAESGAVRLAEPGEHGLALLPPGGDVLALTNARVDAPAQLLVAFGRPHRRPYFKYVGYGGGFIHRSVGEVEAAMAEYESDPTNYGRGAAAARAKPPAATAVAERYALVPGFQSDSGEMLERPAGIVARFTRRPVA